MRTLRMSLVGTAILMSLGGLPVLAQDPEQATWTHVTGTALEAEWTGDRPNDPTHLWHGSVEYIPTSSGSYTAEWSDPRLPTTMRLQQDAALHHGDMTSYDDWMLLHAIAVRLDGTHGDWAGSGHGVFGTDGGHGQVTLTGGGAYEGLSALLDLTRSATDLTVLEFDGFIFESDLPPMPDPVEPSTD